MEKSEGSWIKYLVATVVAGVMATVAVWGIQAAQRIVQAAQRWPWAFALILDLPMDEGEGTTARDVSGYGMDATLRKANGALPSWVSARGDYALSFDGIGSFLEVPDSPLWAFGTDSVAIDFWMRAPNNTTADIITQSNDNDEDCFNLKKQNDGSLLLWLREGGVEKLRVTTGPGILPNDEWCHILLTRVNGVWQFYVDDEAVDTFIQRGTGAESWPDFTYPLLIGARLSGGRYWEFFDGLLDDFKIYRA